MTTLLDISLSRPPLVVGKTKRIYELIGDPTRVILESKDDITAGDGAKRDIIVGKAKLSTQTICNVFPLLKACGIPVAFAGRINSIAFEAPKCTMLPYEVIIRREAHGSYLDRNPHLAKGYLFPHLLLEFFLKTSGEKWQGIATGMTYALPKNDPLIQFDPAGCIHLFYPGYTSEERVTASKGALVGQKPFLSFPESEVFSQPAEKELLESMGKIARQTFLILEKAWQLQGRTLVDFKVEFGIGPGGELLLADVIDNDSWRVVDGSGNYLDKQVYRDGGDLNTVTANYRQVTELTGQFSIPSQQLILWRGSETDDLKPFHEPLTKLSPKPLVAPHEVTCSVHKQPTLAYRILKQLVHKVPDTVIIAFIGRSNGAGPTLSANTTVPVITVPANYKDFPEDVWSSLRTPSNVPVMTVLEPANATLAALEILAMRNPSIYAALQFDLETRLSEV